MGTEKITQAELDRFLEFKKERRQIRRMLREIDSDESDHWKALHKKYGWPEKYQVEIDHETGEATVTPRDEARKSALLELLADKLGD